MILAAILAPASTVASALADCAARFEQAPEAEESARCFWEAGKDPKQRDAAVRQMEALLRERPRHPWLTFYLGNFHWEEPELSGELFRSAAQRLHERGLPVGEVRARYNLYRQLLRQNRKQEAEAEIRRAVLAAEASGDPLAIAQAKILEATHSSEQKADLQHAYRLLLEARERLFPGGPYTMRRDLLIQQANIDFELGRLDEALRNYRRLAELTVENDDGYAEAAARYSLLRAVRDELALLPEPGARERCLALAQKALAVAGDAGNREIEGKAHTVLGLLLPGPEARPHFERCYELLHESKDRSWCRSALAHSLIRDDPKAALKAVDEALALALQANSPWAIAYSWRERMRVSWRLGPPRQAIHDSLAALDAIEVLRDLQTGETGRSEVFSTWLGHYHWLAGRLLQENDLDLGFQVQERMRARALIDALEAVRVAPAFSPESLKLQARRAAVLAEISQIQRRLLDRTEADGTGLELRRKEREEQELRDAIAQANPAFSALRRPGFASLEKVRGALAADEALLSFQIAPWEDMVGDFMGGAWLTVVTRDRVTVHPLRGALANRTNLRPAVESFSGSISAGGDNPQGAAALYKALLADGLARLDSRVQRLVVVPDDVLHRLPFAALRTSAGAAPLASRYEIALAPSATLWLHWRETRPAPAVTPALVLADPVTLATKGDTASERSATVLTPVRLGRLPYARTEGESVVRHLGGAELLQGKDASEAYIKRNGAEPYGLVHFAAHAVTDEVNPDRSGIYLSPGDRKEDGLLQAREIVDLDLEGRVVVLSTCESASGEILRGEGVMGLARAFFQAGAHTVVASLWPLRDDHGAALFDRFYHHLAKGRSVAAALRAAQQDRMNDGAPPAAWAGVVVLGDGDRVPVPGGRGPGWAIWLAVWLAVVALLSLTGLLLRRRGAAP